MFPKIYSAFHFSGLIPELSVLCVDLLLLVLNVFMRHRPTLLARLSYALCFFVALFALSLFSLHLFHPAYFFWGGMYLNDALMRLAGIISCLVYILSLLYAQISLNDSSSDFYPLSLMCLLGCFVMASANHWLTLYLGLEMFSIALYALIAFDRDSPHTAEAAMKYFILGAVSSSFFLFGVSYFYGVLGNAHMQNHFFFHSVFFNYLLISFFVLFMLSTVCFKLGVFPFHAWVADVYSGAATPALPFLMSLSKVAAVIFSLRVLVHAFSDVHAIWAPITAALALVTILFGNVVAIAQTNIKRMLAFSGTAQMGFILLSFFSSYSHITHDFSFLAIACRSSFFFILAYALSVFVALAPCFILSRNGEKITRISDLSGLFQKKPLWATLASFGFFSLAGLPPFLGFWAKFAVLSSLVKSGHVWVALFAILFSVVGVFYYLRMVKIMFFDSSQEDVQWHMPVFGQWLWSTNSLLLLLLGLFTHPLVYLIDQVARSVEF